MTTSVLLPCPFCGGSRASVTSDFGFRAGCPDCHAQAGGSSSIAQAIAAWNRRPSPADQRTARLDLFQLHDLLYRAGWTGFHPDDYDPTSEDLIRLVELAIEADRASRPAAPVPPSPVTQLCGVCHMGLIPPGGICSMCVAAAPVPGEGAK